MKSIIVTKDELRKIKQLQKHFSDPSLDRKDLETIHMVPNGNGWCYASDGISLLVQNVPAFSELRGQISIDGISKIRQGRAVIDVATSERNPTLDARIASVVMPDADIKPTVVFVDPKRLARLLLAFDNMVAIEIYGRSNPVKIFSTNDENSTDGIGVLMPMHSSSAEYYSPMELHMKLKEK